MLAIEAFSTEGLYIHGYSVSRLHMGNPLSYFLYNAYYFVANSNPRYCARHRTMLDMKITGADTAQRYSYDGIMLIYYRCLFPKQVFFQRLQQLQRTELDRVRAVCAGHEADLGV